jgi:hypothetical protein
LESLVISALLAKLKTKRPLWSPKAEKRLGDNQKREPVPVYAVSVD